ncbi:MAG: hypothetical protein JW894_01740 [Bacteroidales bacterium]|nr:hypothetical protein [Bacteroidales bacterium]
MTVQTSTFVKALSLIIYIFLLNNLYAQERSIRIIGTSEYNYNPLPNTKVILYKDGKEIRTLHTGADGEFRFDLDLNSEYLITLEKAGYLGKKIAFNTDLPDEVIGKWTIEFAMTLYIGCEGVDASALNDPVDRIKFSTNKNDFISDEVYAQKMRGRLEQLLVNIERCETEKFQEARSEGDKLYQANNLAEAREKYEEALSIYPNDRYSKKKIEDINEKIGENKQNQEIFDRTVAEADKFLSEEQYEAARIKFNEALRAMPQNNYPREKIAEIDDFIRANEQAHQAELDKEREYNGFIAKANAALNAQNYIAAKGFFEQALLINPTAAFPKQKITELESLIKKQKEHELADAAHEKSYSEAMAMGQNALVIRDYETARQHFSRAQMLKPSESLPREKMAEIDEQIRADKLADMQAQKAEIQQKIKAALDEGDKQFQAGNYAAAEVAYQQVLQFNPNDAYAKQRLNRAKSLVLAAEAEKQQAMEKAFKEIVDNGDAFIVAKSYEQAISAYKQAMLQKPNDPVLLNKIAEAEQMLAMHKQKEAADKDKKKRYDQFIAQGNSLLAANKLTEAQSAYQSALQIFPDQTLPRNKINEINALLDQKTKEEQHRQLISKADALFASKEYSQAKTLYEQALSLNAADSYARQKIGEIDGIIRENERLEAEEVAKTEQYNRIIREADNLFALKRNPEAKATYQRALGLKPAETYPQQQITLINNMVAEEQRALQEQQAREQQYREAISRADAAFNTKNYADARTIYQQALALKNAETYPRQKIIEIDQILREQQLRDEQYERTLTEANNLFTAKQLESAKQTYNRALSIKPTEAYPKSQIAKIDALIAEQIKKENEQKAIEFQYSEAIKMADKLYGMNDLIDAKSYYQRALSVKANEQYPQSQISKIDAQLAALEKEKQEKLAFEQKYNAILGSADKAYNQRDYKSAKNSYMEALEMKPSDSYPQEQLNKIAEFERILAQQEASRNVTVPAGGTAVGGAATVPAAGKLADLNFQNDSERDKYLNELRKEYPEGVTLEVHKEKTKTTHRYVVIRDSEVREFRQVKFNWGGVEFTLNGTPITSQYFNSQVKVREGEYFKKIEM